MIKYNAGDSILFLFFYFLVCIVIYYLPVARIEQEVWTQINHGMKTN